MTYQDRMWDAVSEFITEISRYPGFREWKHEKLSRVLAGEFREVLYSDDELGDFRFSEETEQQHEFVMLYMNLIESNLALKDVEYYFRRYPFKNLPVSHHSHLRYICEMFFSRIYETRERLKKYLNALNANVDQGRLEVGKFIKTFNKEFELELKARNRIHHHSSFDDIDLSHVFIAGILPDEEGQKEEHTYIYRRVSKQWAERVRKRSAQIDVFLEAVSQASIEHCSMFSELEKRRKRSKHIESG